MQYPPQAGEKRLCLTIFCAMMTAVMSAVVVIYSIVIVYNPSIIELQSNLQVQCIIQSLGVKHRRHIYVLFSFYMECQGLDAIPTPVPSRAYKELFPSFTVL